MYPTTILSATLAFSGLASANLSVSSRATRGTEGGCPNRFCDVKLDGQLGCTKGTATFAGLCYQRGASNDTQLVTGCDGIEVRYIVDGMHGAGSGIVVVTSTVNDSSEEFSVSECKPVSGKVPLGVPCVGLSGTCQVG